MDGAILQDCMKPYRESVSDKHAFDKLYLKLKRLC